MSEIRTVAIVGTGTIGASWTSLFLANGFDVVASDPAPEAEVKLRAFVARALPDCRRSAQVRVGRLWFVPRVEDAVAHCDLVQENAPEREALKADLFATLEGAAPPHAILASSTTAFPHSKLVSKVKDPARVIVAHPFNPPHLVPLVELVGAKPDAPAIRAAFEFYKSLGQEPVILKKEAVGHLANRLQAALMREALYILEQGIADVDDIDRAVRHGPGLRWAFMGPFQTFHLAGGPGGIRHYIAHLFDSQRRRWASLGEPVVDDDLKATLVEGIERMTDGRSIAELEVERDRALKAILAARNG